MLVRTFKARPLTLLSLPLILISFGCNSGSDHSGTSDVSVCAAAPSVPKDLAASDITSASVSLSWSASTVGSGCSLTGYKVYQNGTLVSSPTTNSAAITGLAASTAYSFTVASVDGYGASAASNALSVTTAADPNNPDAKYADALTKAVQFYDGQRCGPDVETNNVFSWRKNCHLSDHSLQRVNGHTIDMTGGFHDAGDYIKMGVTQTFVPSVIGSALWEYRSAFDAAGSTTKTLSTLKRFTDYFIKCYEPGTPGIFWYLVGSDLDHETWRLPEADTTDPNNPRGSTPPDNENAYWADATHGASDICGYAAAALAQMSLNYRSTDSTYADLCLTRARQLYILGKTTLGTGMSNEDGWYYNNGDVYYSNLAWAGVWLYQATQDSTFLDEAKTFITKAETGALDGMAGWGDIQPLVSMKLYQLTKDTTYLNQVKINLDAFKNSPRTPGGLVNQGNEGDPLLGYDCAEAYVSLHYGNVTGDTTYKALAKAQLDYILGANPKSTAMGKNWSYMVGFGTGSWPVHLSHPETSDYSAADPENPWDAMKHPDKYQLTGAIVGGPMKDDTYNDSDNPPEKSRQDEPAIDYNAGAVAAFAALIGNK